MTDKPRYRVVIVDDHAMLRTGVRHEIAGAVDVVGEGEDVASGVAAIRRFVPDVVLLDVHLPGGGGAEVMKQAELASVRYLALSVSDAAEDVIGTIRAGARGYVTKSISGPDLVDAIIRVAEGDAVFPQALQRAQESQMGAALAVHRAEEGHFAVQGEQRGCRCVNGFVHQHFPSSYLLIPNPSPRLSSEYYHKRQRLWQFHTIAPFLRAA